MKLNGIEDPLYFQQCPSMTMVPDIFDDVAFKGSHSRISFEISHVLQCINYAGRI